MHTQITATRLKSHLGREITVPISQMLEMRGMLRRKPNTNKLFLAIRSDRRAGRRSLRYFLAKGDVVKIRREQKELKAYVNQRMVLSNPPHLEVRGTLKEDIGHGIFFLAANYKQNLGRVQMCMYPLVCGDIIRPVESPDGRPGEVVVGKMEFDTYRFITYKRRSLPRKAVAKNS